MTDFELYRAQDYAHGRGVCGHIGPYRHLCTRWTGHVGQHQGVRQEETDERVYASWGG